MLAVVAVDELLLLSLVADEELLSVVADEELLSVVAADDAAPELSADELDDDPPEQAVMARAARIATNVVVSERIYYFSLTRERI